RGGPTRSAPPKPAPPQPRSSTNGLPRSSKSAATSRLAAISPPSPGGPPAAPPKPRSRPARPPTKSTSLSRISRELRVMRHRRVWRGGGTMKLERSYVDVVAPPRDEPVRRMRIGHLELPIPGWAIPVFGIIGILSVGYSFLNQPIQTIYSRYLLGTAEELDQQEAYKHFAEAPAMQLRDTGT